MTISKQEVSDNLDQVKNYINQIEAENLKEKKEVCIEIKNRWTGSVIFKSTKTTWKEALEEAKTHTNLTDADLTDADLTDANLTGANLTNTNLTHANLTDANLTGANLTGANLTNTNLTDADLTDADLTDADLTDADLTHTNLTHTNLTDANLTGANLNGCLYYLGAGNKNFEALCKAIKTIRHQDGKFEDLAK